MLCWLEVARRVQLNATLLQRLDGVNADRVERGIVALQCASHGGRCASDQRFNHVAVQQLGAGLESAEKPRCSARKSPPGGAAAVVFEELLVVVEELVGVFEGSSREEV